MLDIKNIPVYNENDDNKTKTIKKSKTTRKYMDDHYKNMKGSDKSFLHNYFNNVYEGNKNK